MHHLKHCRKRKTERALTLELLESRYLLAGDLALGPVFDDRYLWGRSLWGR